MNANVQKERPGSAPSTAWGRQWQFTLKELRETLRDRRTTVTLLAMPLLLYPLLGLGFRFVAWQQHGEQASEFLVAVETEAEARWLNDVLAAGQQLLLQELPGQDPSELSPRLSLVIPEDEATFDLVSVVSRREVDMGVRVTLADPLPDGAPQTARVELILCDGFSVGRDAADFVRDRLHRLNLAAISHWALQQNTEIQIPITEHSTVVPPQAEPSAILGLLPLILLLMTVTGGVYPAIDLTAGERERNTLETLMALPVPRFRILLAKFVAVFAVTMLTGLMNLVAMSVTVYALALETTLFGNAGLTAGLAIQLGFVLTVFALFYSALLLMLTSTARSFKEAQAYLIPLLLLSLAPGLVILLPGWSLHHGTAMVPLMNMLLVARALFEGEADPVLALLAIASTLLYALAALAVAAQTFGNEALSVGGQRRWRDLWKRPDKPERLPTADTAAVALAAMFPVYFLASGLLGRAVLPAGEHLMLSALLTILLFAVCPATLLYWQRVPIASGLSLSKPALRLWVAAIILGLATWPWIFEFLNVLRSFGIFRIAPQTLEQVEHLLILWQSVPLVLIVVSLGLIPGICEEIFFRGLLLSAIRRQLGAAGAVLATAVAFGLFHVVLAGGRRPVETASLGAYPLQQPRHSGQLGNHAAHDEQPGRPSRTFGSRPVSQLRRRPRRSAQLCLGDPQAGRLHPPASQRDRRCRARQSRTHAVDDGRCSVQPASLPPDREQVVHGRLRTGEQLRSDPDRVSSGTQPDPRRSVGHRPGMVSADGRSLAMCDDQRSSERRRVLSLSGDHRAVNGSGAAPRHHRPHAAPTSRTLDTGRHRPGIDDERNRHPFGKTHFVQPGFDLEALPGIRDWFENYYTIRFRNYPVDEHDIQSAWQVPCEASA